MRNLLSKYEQYVMAATRAPVGASRVLLNADDSACRRGECNIGNFLAEEIANQVPAVDVVVGGHSHSFLYTGKSAHISVTVQKRSKA